jgi:hypothetical protein
MVPVAGGALFTLPVVTVLTSAVHRDGAAGPDAASDAPEDRRSELIG